jgi:hypothetical protein
MLRDVEFQVHVKGLVLKENKRKKDSMIATTAIGNKNSPGCRRRQSETQEKFGCQDGD